MSSLSYISTSKRKQLQEQEKIFWLNLRTLSLWALKTLYSDFFFVNTTPREMRRKNNKRKSISAWMLSKLFLPTQPSLPGHPRSRVLRWEEWKVFLCCLLSSRRIPLIIVDSRVAEDENQTAPRLDNTRKEISRKEANYLFKNSPKPASRTCCWYGESSRWSSSPNRIGMSTRRACPGRPCCRCSIRPIQSLQKKKKNSN